MQYSSFQLAIFNKVEHGTGNGIADAVAGSGKSTTIKRCFLLVSSGLKSVFLAFNKAIVAELNKDGVPAKTLNGLGFGAVMRNFERAPVLNGDKIPQMIIQMVSWDDRKLYGTNINRLIGLAKGIGLVPRSHRIAAGRFSPLVEDSDDAWYGLIDKYDIDLGQNPAATMEGLIGHCREVLTQSLLNVAEIDFDDQKYLPVVMDLPMTLHDFIFLDECQDLNAVDRALVQKSLKRTGRLFAVGDPHQAIYGWRGADVNSFDLIEQTFNCERFPLSVCYRCPSSVIELAKTWVPHIQAAPDAPEGKVESLRAYDEANFAAADLVLCRNNAPLIRLAYRLMGQRKPVVILGRDFGKKLITLVQKLSEGLAQDDQYINNLYAKIETYRFKENDKFVARGMESKAAALHDMCDALFAVIDTGDAETLAGIIQEMDGLFSDEARRNAVTLSTIHKMKGGQAKHVFILDWGLLPSPWAKSADAMQQEQNLQYVAVTRAQETLTFIETDGWKKEQPKMEETADA